ncbi:MAG TPA: ADP-heptose--LPS heptosyltransferase, partial [Chloroflexota bacterium]|nr:ADP-heptose--LPS heptosyltransferase [Chloroflexota bacterium]
MPTRSLPDDWLEAMRDGDFGRAWRIGDAVIADERSRGAPDLPRWLRRVWDGQPLAGKTVLVRCWRGLGDTLQFSRFLPDLAAICRQVQVAPQPELAPLVARIAPLASIVPFESQGGSEAEVEITELGHILRVSTADAAARVPYLDVAPALRPSRAFNVGIVAESGSWDARRCVPVSALEPLAGVSGSAFFSLRPGACISWAADVSSRDVWMAAARVRSLDLVITADTFMAHLAGSMGVPTWTLLHTEPDWRWLRGDNTPWYPEMRLFRQ